MQRHRHLDAGLAGCPDAAVEARQCRDVFAGDRDDDVAGPDFGARRRPFRGDADDDDAVFDFGAIDAEPWPHRLVDTAEFRQVAEDRLQQVDRDRHVEIFRRAFAAAFAHSLDLQRADADQIPLRRD